jgi:hypothetical protein
VTFSTGRTLYAAGADAVHPHRPDLLDSATQEPFCHKASGGQPPCLVGFNRLGVAASGAVQTPSEGPGQPNDSTSPPVEQAAQSEEGGNLPLTGFAGRLPAALGAALTLGGAVTVLLAHRRRGRHSSASG